jgi:hypothetical protein
MGRLLRERALDAEDREPLYPRWTSIQDTDLPDDHNRWPRSMMFPLVLIIAAGLWALIYVMARLLFAVPG